MKYIKVVTGQQVSSELITNYFRDLINKFFKILPMRENNEVSLIEYLKSFRSELIGTKGVIPELQDNSQYLTLISILQYLIDNICDESFSVIRVRREVFKAISICEKLKSMYSALGVKT